MGLSAPAIATRKVRDGGEPLVMVTAYDAPGARIASEAGADLILVGDSVAMVVLGYDDTLQVTVDDMVHHTAAVARAKPACHIVGDLLDAFFHAVDGEDLGPAASHFEGDAGTVFADSDHHIAHALHGCNLLRRAEALLEEDEESGHVRKPIVHRNRGEADHGGTFPRTELRCR